jgi:hypothetical protein
MSQLQNELRLTLLGKNMFDRCENKEGVSIEELTDRYNFLRQNGVENVIELKDVDELIRICNLRTDPFKDLSCDIIMNILKTKGMTFKDIQNMSSTSRNIHICVDKELNNKLGVSLSELNSSIYLKMNLNLLNNLITTFNLKNKKISDNEIILTFDKGFFPESTYHIKLRKLVETEQLKKKYYNVFSSDLYHFLTSKDENVIATFKINSQVEFDDDEQFILDINIYKYKDIINSIEKYKNYFLNFSIEHGIENITYLNIQYDLGNSIIYEYLSSSSSVENLLQKRSSSLFEVDE